MSPAAVMPLARNEPLLLEPVEGVGDPAAPEHLLRRQREAFAHAVAEVIVELKQRQRLGLQAPQTAFQAALDRAGDVVHVVCLKPDLGGDMGLQGQRPQMTADRLLRCAIAVDGRGVDPVDAGRHRALQRVVPDRLVGIDQNAAGDTAAEREL